MVSELNGENMYIVSKTKFGGKMKTIKTWKQMSIDTKIKNKKGTIGTQFILYQRGFSSFLPTIFLEFWFGCYSHLLHLVSTVVSFYILLHINLGIDYRNWSSWSSHLFWTLNSLFGYFHFQKEWFWLVSD